jgi:hypothetical protein
LIVERLKKQLASTLFVNEEASSVENNIFSISVRKVTSGKLIAALGNIFGDLQATSRLLIEEDEYRDWNINNYILMEQSIADASPPPPKSFDQS